MTLFNFYSTKNSVIRFNGGLYAASVITPTETPEELDTSNFEGAGVSDAVNGLFTLRITIEIIIDGANNPWDLAVLVPTPAGGPYPTNLSCYTNGVGSPRWFLPFYLIGECSSPEDVKSFGKGTIKVRNKGAYTRPTGVISPTN